MRRALTGLLFFVHYSTAGYAQQRSQPIPIRQVVPATARTAEPLGAVAGLRQLPGGRVIIHDSRARRLLVFDSTLRSYAILADTFGAGGRYPRFGLQLIPYLADTTLLVDVDSRSLVAIGPDGKMGRVMSAPNARDLANMRGALSDSRGRLVYRVSIPPAKVVGPDGALRSGPPTDSAAIVRADFDTKRVDTLGYVRINVSYLGEQQVSSTGRKTILQTLNPAPPAIDDWTVPAGGTLAIVRGRDYHIDWVDADGTHRSTPRMAFDWRRLTDDDKRAKIDSAKKIMDSVTATRPNFLMESRPDGKADTVFLVTEYAAIDKMADYIPPLRSGSVRADEDGNVWILPTTSGQAKDGLLYDVVNERGEVFERVQLPAGRDIAGFGRGGVIYVWWRDSSGSCSLERTSVRR